MLRSGFGPLGRAFIYGFRRRRAAEEFKKRYAQ